MAGGLVTRPGNALLPIEGLPQPNALGSTLPELARVMIRQWR
jgi:2-haloacid dehalogenase